MDALKNSIIAIVASLALTSCLSKEEPKTQEEKYNFIESEINKESSLFDNEKEISTQKEKLVTTALDEALQNKEFVYAKRYCILLSSLNYPESEKYEGKIRNAKSAALKDSLITALKEYDFTNAKRYCDNLKLVKYTEFEKCKKIIDNAEASFLISQRTEEANAQLISKIDTVKAKKTEIGKETESVHIYDLQAKTYNNKIDEYLGLALDYKNDVLANKLLNLYVEELSYKSLKKNGHDVNVVTGYSNERKIKATKRYQEEKSLWD